ncbi:MAG: ribonuclease Z [Myxococcota bacterium]|nr:ribonuclease Z [Myxococcota bacterium]
MECIALGTGGMMPMPLRLTTSVLVRRQGRMLMFDAGEGIQLALKQGNLGIRRLDAIAVSHLHADHVLGIPGILMFRAQNQDPGPLSIIGPPGIERFVRHTLDDIQYYINYALNFVEWKSHDTPCTWEWHGVKLSWEPLDHSTFCLGYRLEEPPRPGTFYPERARALGVPVGPLFSQLQAGQSVTTPDGRTVHSNEVLGPPKRGRIVSYATDTRPCPGLAQLLRNADLAFVEGMFSLFHKEEAEKKGHMTAAQAATVAAAASVKHLILVHISPRYTRQDEAVLASEARAQFPSVEIARSLGSYPVPLPSESQ